MFRHHYLALFSKDSWNKLQRTPIPKPCHLYVCVCLCEPWAYLGVESCASVVIPGQEAEVCLLVKLPKKWGLEILVGVYLLKFDRFDVQVLARETEKRLSSSGRTHTWMMYELESLSSVLTKKLTRSWVPYFSFSLAMTSSSLHDLPWEEVTN